MAGDCGQPSGGQKKATFQVMVFGQTPGLIAGAGSGFEP